MEWGPVALRLPHHLGRACQVSWASCSQHQPLTKVSGLEESPGTDIADARRGGIVGTIMLPLRYLETLAIELLKVLSGAGKVKFGVSVAGLREETNEVGQWNSSSLDWLLFLCRKCANSRCLLPTP
eukprot:763772-Hanusia_phi.AAC.1